MTAPALHAPRVNRRFTRHIDAGEVLFDVGERGHEAFIVAAGAVEIVGTVGGERRRLARLGPNELFGEMALMGDQTRTAQAIACEPTTVYVIPHDTFSGCLHRADPLLRHLLRLTILRARAALRDDLASQLIPPDYETLQDDHLDAEREVVLQRLLIEQDLAEALERDEFSLHYQPILRLADGDVTGFEALLRWRHPAHGAVSPAVFVPVAEASGQIVPMGHWIIDTAVAAAARIATRPGPTLTVALNLSIRQFDDPQLFPTIEAALARHQLAPDRLKLEITESLVMSNFDASRDLLRRCKDRGIGLSVDDFGTGYSSLSYLHQLPVDTLKLDRSFLSDVLTNPASLKIVRAVARLAADLGMQTVAEGVETTEQAEALKAIGIDCAQGFLYARPAPLDQVLESLQSA